MKNQDLAAAGIMAVVTGGMSLLYWPLCLYHIMRDDVSFEVMFHPLKLLVYGGGTALSIAGLIVWYLASRRRALQT